MTVLFVKNSLKYWRVVASFILLLVIITRLYAFLDIFKALILPLSDIIEEGIVRIYR